MGKTEALTCLQDWHNRESIQPSVTEQCQRVSAAIVEVAGASPPNQEA